MATTGLKRSHKFGVELFKTVEQAHSLHAENDNDLQKEMENVKVAFKIFKWDQIPEELRRAQGTEQACLGKQCIPCSARRLAA